MVVSKCSGGDTSREAAGHHLVAKSDDGLAIREIKPGGQRTETGSGHEDAQRIGPAFEDVLRINRHERQVGRKAKARNDHGDKKPARGSKLPHVHHSLAYGFPAAIVLYPRRVDYK